MSARYLLACDGGRAVGSQVGISMEGALAMVTNITFHFAADLSRWVRGEDILVRTIINPEIGVPRVLVPVGPKKTLLSGDDSSGRQSVHDIIVQPGCGLPPHCRTDGHTYWYVVSGSIQIGIGPVREAAEANAFAYAPPETTQSLVNASDAPGAGGLGRDDRRLE